MICLKKQAAKVKDGILSDYEGHICSYSSWLEDLHVVGRLKVLSRLPFFKKYIVIDVVHAFTIYGHRDVAMAQYELGTNEDFTLILKNIELWSDMQQYYSNCKLWLSYVNDVHKNY